MKKMAVVAGLAVLSTSAFATRARMEALGQAQAQGSYFMRDSRTIFRNASHINDQKNYIYAELGDSAAANNGTNGNGEAEGGFVKDAGKFVYGVMLNFQRDDASAIGTVDGDLDGATNTANDARFLGEDERIDLFFGGDAGIQWGVNLSYAYQKDENNDDNDGAGTIAGNSNSTQSSTYNYLGLNLGMTMGDIEGWLNMDINEEAEGAIEDGTGAAIIGSENYTSEGDFSFQVGFSYAMRDHVLYVEYDKDGKESNLQTGNNDAVDFEETVLTLGVAKMMEVNEKSRWFWDIALRLDEQETTLGQVSRSIDNNDLQFTVGFESDVRSWLTLRGSIQQNVIYSRLDTELVDGATATNSNSDDGTQFSTTTANLGATVTLGDIAVDGVLGVNEDDTAANSTFNKRGRFGFGDNMFTRVAVTYNF